jgi:alpha-aminoadipate carrier protein LysW
MQENCIDCGAELLVLEDALNDEIISCPDCGLDYVFKLDDNGRKKLLPLTIEGEDWGE